MSGTLSDYLKNKLLDHVFRNVSYTSPTTVYIGVFPGSAPPSGSGPGTEISGTSYARVAVTRGAAAAGSSANSVAATFPAAGGVWALPADPISWFGSFDALTAGNMLEYGELIGAGKVSVFDATTDTATSSAHGFLNGDQVVVRVANGTIPGGSSASTVYFVVGRTTNTFQLSLTLGGAAVDITSTGNGTITVHACNFRAILAGDTLNFPIASLATTIT